MEDRTSRNISYYIFLALVTAGFVALLVHLFFSIFWAAVIAGIFNPIYRRLNRRINAGLAAGIVFVIIAALVIFPVGLIGGLLLAESSQILQTLNGGDIQFDKNIRSFLNVIERSFIFSHLGLSEEFLQERVSQAIQGIANYVLTHLTGITQNTLSFLVKFFIMLYCLFFFLRDGDKLKDMVLRLKPFGGDIERFLYQRLLATTNSTIKATLIIGGIQGILGGAVFFITGIEGALLWGIIMMVASVLPVVGSAIVWAPAGVIMLLGGHVWEGILILAYGAGVISLVDNLLRPLLIGRGAQIHPLIIFLSTLGGIMVFGFSGFILGPVISSLFLSAWSVYGQLNQRDAVNEEEQ
ncbi:MAG: AI-2E family transporter [Smithellaceae bacterium]|nr:AI-2E family transporter [Smithellaceae bacterium]